MIVPLICRRDIVAQQVSLTHSLLTDVDVSLTDHRDAAYFLSFRQLTTRVVHKLHRIEDFSARIRYVRRCTMRYI